MTPLVTLVHVRTPRTWCCRISPPSAFPPWILRSTLSSRSLPSLSLLISINWSIGKTYSPRPHSSPTPTYEALISRILETQSLFLHYGLPLIGFLSRLSDYLRSVIFRSIENDGRNFIWTTMNPWVVNFAYLEAMACARWRVPRCFFDCANHIFEIDDGSGRQDSLNDR